VLCSALLLLVRDQAQQAGRDDQAKAMQAEALQLDPKALDGMKGNSQ
jgi:hypothetical protein